MGINFFLHCFPTQLTTQIKKNFLGEKTRQKTSKTIRVLDSKIDPPYCIVIHREEKNKNGMHCGPLLTDEKEGQSNPNTVQPNRVPDILMKGPHL